MKPIAVFCVIFALIFGVAACSEETEHDKIKKVIADVQVAGEAKDIKQVMTHVSDAYSDPRGNNAERIRSLLRGYFLYYPKIRIYLNSLEIFVEDTSARAVFQAVLTHSEKTGSLQDLIPQSLGVWDFDVTLKKESGKWKVMSATWEPSEIVLPD